MFATLEVVATLALALSQGRTCADCRGDARRPLLCAPHAEIERVTLREQGSLYAKAEDAEQRIAALDKVAQLTREHTNAPSPFVARFLADAVKDPELSVRRRAVTLLLDGQNREEAIRGVLESWKEAQKIWRVLDAKLVLSEAPSDGKAVPVALTTEELVQIPDYVDHVIRALGALRDDRALNALQTFLRSPLDRTPGRFLVNAAEAMLELDSRHACELVIELLDDLEAAFVEGVVPRRFTANPKTDFLSALKEPLENASSHEHAQILAALERYAKSKGLAAPETSESVRATGWKSWFKGAREQLPEKVTRRE